MRAPVDDQLSDLKKFRGRLVMALYTIQKTDQEMFEYEGFELVEVTVLESLDGAEREFQAISAMLDTYRPRVQEKRDAGVSDLELSQDPEVCETFNGLLKSIHTINLNLSLANHGLGLLRYFSSNPQSAMLYQ